MKLMYVGIYNTIILLCMQIGLNIRDNYQYMVPHPSLIQANSSKIQTESVNLAHTKITKIYPDPIYYTLIYITKDRKQCSHSETKSHSADL